MNDANELISFIASMSGEGNLRVEENLGEGYVRLRVSEAERRQAKHDIQHVEDIVIEMLRNARDAGADKVYLATTKEEGVRTLLFLDNGSGVPQDMQVIGFDNVPDAEYCMPGLTTIDPHVDDYARHAVDMLIARIEGTTEPARRYVTSFDLVRRDSTR